MSGGKQELLRVRALTRDKQSFPQKKDTACPEAGGSRTSPQRSKSPSQPLKHGDQGAQLLLVFSGAGDSDSAHLQKGKCLGGNHYWKVLETVWFFGCTELVRKLLTVFSGVSADSNASKTQGPG